MPFSTSSSGYLDLRDLAVVVLDDNANTRTLIAEVLHGLGVRNIYRASHGAEALSVMRSHTVDVLLTDIELDREDGLSFVKLLRDSADPKLAKVAVIVVSSHATEARVMQAGVVGADGFLSKPFNVGGFARRLTEGLAGRRHMNQARRPPVAPPIARPAVALNQLEL